MEQILHSKPWIAESDIEAVSAILSSSMLAQGERTRMLEHRLASWLNAVDGVGVASGSSGVVLALHGLMIGDGDEVILPTYVCRSLLEAVLASRATPVLCDVGWDWVMTANDAKRVVSTKTRAIVVPHIYGIFADIDSFRTLGVPIIEDCAQALDAPGIRSAKGDVTLLSFHPTKCLTSGEGGMVISSDANILERMRAYRDGSDTGYKARFFSPLSDILASLALAQLDRYEEGLSRRQQIASTYMAAIESCCPNVLNRGALGNSMFFRFPLRVRGGLDECQQAFADLGIQVRKGVDALLHRGMGQADQAFPVAVELFETTISIPIYPALSRSQELQCIKAVTQVLSCLH
ncbi:MAG: DegT/DnrJ/EryC1/StrS aminotransferase family protein [Sulfuricella sp.]|nr:DegT/DnrJ/EryC1/StrS aminotransferase family protein [Sulfuricella sp.]